MPEIIPSSRRSITRPTSRGMSATASRRRVPPPAHRDRHRADTTQQIILEVAGKPVGGGRVENERGDLCGGQPVVQPAALELRDERAHRSLPPPA